MFSGSSSSAAGSTPSSSFGTVPTSTTLTQGGTPVSESLVPQTNAIDVTFRQTTINGVSYPTGLIMGVGSSSGELQIAAERQYTHFTGQLGIPDDQNSDSAYMVSISLDNSAPVLSTQVHFGTTTPLNINITGALRIKIDAISISHCCGRVAIGNPGLS